MILTGTFPSCKVTIHTSWQVLFFTIWQNIWTRYGIQPGTIKYFTTCLSTQLFYTCLPNRVENNYYITNSTHFLLAYAIFWYHNLFFFPGLISMLFSKSTRFLLIICQQARKSEDITNMSIFILPNTSFKVRLTFFPRLFSRYLEIVFIWKKD